VGPITKSPPGFGEGYVPYPGHLVTTQELIAQANPIMELAKTRPIPGSNGIPEPTGPQSGSVKNHPSRLCEGCWLCQHSGIYNSTRTGGRELTIVKAQGVAGASASASVAPNPIGRLSLCETVSQGGSFSRPSIWAQ